MQAFSNRLFYNEETGYFEQVHNQNMMYGGGNITPSSSLSTLYLPEEAIGAVRNFWIILAPIMKMSANQIF